MFNTGERNEESLAISNLILTSNLAPMIKEAFLWAPKDFMDRSQPSLCRRTRRRKQSMITRIDLWRRPTRWPKEPPMGILTIISLACPISTSTKSLMVFSNQKILFTDSPQGMILRIFLHRLLITWMLSKVFLIEKFPKLALQGSLETSKDWIIKRLPKMIPGQLQLKGMFLALGFTVSFSSNSYVLKGLQAAQEFRGRFTIKKCFRTIMAWLRKNQVCYQKNNMKQLLSK